MSRKLVQEAQIVPAFIPVDAAAGAKVGDFVSLSKFRHCAIVAIKADGAAGEDITFTVEQAKDVAGTGAKALTFTEVYEKVGADLAAIGQFSKVTQAAANTYENTASGEAEAVFVIEIDAEQLDTTNGFSAIRVSTDDPGATAQLIAVFYVLTHPRYRDETVPSAIVD